MALPLAREAAPPWQVLIGPFTADHVEAELDHGVPLLFVPNDLQRAEVLAHQFEGRGGLLSFSRDLLGAEDREVCWYRYSDCRFDGVAAPEALHHLAPNLRLRDLELRPVVRLDSLIHSWANRDPALAALVSAGGGRVWLQGKQPVPIVAGVSRLVEVIGAFCWTPLGTPVDPPDAPAAEQQVGEWLEASGFHPAERRPVNDQCAAPSLVWRQDPLRRAVLRQQHLEGELAQVRQDRDRAHLGAEAQRQEAEAQRQEAQALRQQIAQLQEGWEAQQQALQAEVAVERSELEAEVGRLTGERDTLRQELDTLRQESEAQRQWAETLRQQRVVLEQGLESQRQGLQAAAAAERAGLEAEIVRLAQEGVVQRQSLVSHQQELVSRQQELASLQQELGEAAAQGLQWQAEIERLGQEKGVLRQDADALRQDIDTFRQEAEALRQEAEAMRQDRDALRRETRDEIAAILALLEPDNTLSPDPAAPATP